MKILKESVDFEKQIFDAAKMRAGRHSGSSPSEDRIEHLLAAARRGALP